MIKTLKFSFRLRQALLSPSSQHFDYNKRVKTCLLQDQLVAMNYSDGQDQCDDCICDVIWIFNLKSCQWRKDYTYGAIPHKTFNFSMNYDPIFKQLLIFGGQSTQPQFYSKLYSLDCKNQWKIIHPQKNSLLPQSRSSHAACFIYPYLIIHGGITYSNFVADDTWIFNLITRKWTKIQDEQKPQGRFFHTISFVKNTIYMIGGCQDSSLEAFSHIYSMNLESLLKKNSYQLCWQKLCFKGYGIQRWGHGCLQHLGKLFIFGGKSNVQIFPYHEIIVLDAQKHDITPIRINIYQGQELQFINPSLMFYGSCMIIVKQTGNILYINLYDYIYKSELWHLDIVSEITKNIFEAQIPDMIKFTNIKNQIFYLNTTLLNNIFSDHFQHQSITEHFISIFKIIQISQIQQVLQFIYTGLLSSGTYVIAGYLFPFIYTPKSNSQRFHGYIQLLKKKKFKQVISEDRFQNHHYGIVILSKCQWDCLLTISYFDDKDVKFMLSNNEILQSNSIILSIRSKYYKALLSDSFLQKKNSLVVDWIKPHIFKILIKYIEFDFVFYYEKLCIQDWIELIKLSKYFEYRRLQLICTEQISAHFNQDNISMFLRFAQNNLLDKLKIACISYLFEQCPIESLNNKIYSLSDQHFKLMIEQYQKLWFQLNQEYLRKKKKLIFDYSIKKITTQNY